MTEEDYYSNTNNNILGNKRKFISKIDRRSN